MARPGFGSLRCRPAYRRSLALGPTRAACACTPMCPIGSLDRRPWSWCSTAAFRPQLSTIWAPAGRPWRTASGSALLFPEQQRANNPRGCFNWFQRGAAAQRNQGEAGHWVVRITPEAGTVKTNRAREVILHPQLVELGFPEFVKGVAQGPLFLTPGANGNVLSPSGALNRLANSRGLLCRTRMLPPITAGGIGSRRWGWRQVYRPASSMRSRAKRRDQLPTPMGM